MLGILLYTQVMLTPLANPPQFLEQPAAWRLHAGSNISQRARFKIEAFLHRFNISPTGKQDPVAWLQARIFVRTRKFPPLAQQQQRNGIQMLSVILRADEQITN